MPVGQIVVVFVSRAEFVVYSDENTMQHMEFYHGQNNHFGPE